MKKQIFKFTGIIAVVTVMAASFFVSGKVQPADDIATTLQSIKASATIVGCEDVGVCVYEGHACPYAPVYGL